MRINFVIPSTVLGGGVRMVFAYSNSLTTMGHDVAVYLPLVFSWKDINGGIPNLRTTIGNSIKRGVNVPWYDCHFKLFRVPLVSNRFVRDADITIATAWYTARNVAELSGSKGAKAYFIQGYEIGEDGRNREKVEETYLLMEHNITIARWLDDIVKGVSGRGTFVLHNGVDDGEFISVPKPRNDPRTVIMLGNMAPHKGTRQGIEILRRAQERHGIRVVVYAAEPSSAIPDSFEFYCQPSRDTLMELYTESDICLFPSIREGWGLTVTEAMAHKCAVVGNRTGAVDEIGVDGVNMLVSEPSDFASLEVNLERLMNDENLMKGMQEAGFETVSCMRASRQATKLQDYLQAICGQSWEMNAL